MSKAKFFATGSLIFLLAVFVLQKYVSEEFFMYVGGFLFYFAIALIALIFACFQNRNFFFLLVIIVAILRVYYMSLSEDFNHQFVFDATYSFEANIKTVDRKINGQNIIVIPESLENFSGSIRVSTGLYPQYFAGQQISISCKLQKPENFSDENGKVFEYDKFLAKQNIFATCYYPRISVVKEDLKVGQKIEKYMFANFDIELTEPASSISKAIVLGKKKEIHPEIQTSFSKTGLSHILAISGLHIAIIILLINLLFQKIGLQRQFAFFILLGIILFYLVLINFPPSATRASLMAFIILLRPFIGRQTISIFSLLLLADIFVLVNPYFLLHDIGFQLSFLAVAGILVYSDFFLVKLSWLTNTFKVREIVAITLSAQVFAWPIIVYNFGIFSLVAPLANILILPMLPIVLVIAIAIGIFPLEILTWLQIFLIDLIVKVAKVFSSSDYFYLEFDNFSWRMLLISFFVMIALTTFLKPYKNEKSDI